MKKKKRKFFECCQYIYSFVSLGWHASEKRLKPTYTDKIPGYKLK